jgi:hypothetical protein
MTTVADKANFTAQFIAPLTNDPVEKLGIATALVELFKIELSGRLQMATAPAAPVDTPVTEPAAPAVAKPKKKRGQ